MALFIKKDTNFISPLDRCLQAWRKKAKPTLSQQREIKKCDQVLQKMMQVKSKDNDTTLWEDF